MDKKPKNWYNSPTRPDNPLNNDNTSNQIFFFENEKMKIQGLEILQQHGGKTFELALSSRFKILPQISDQITIQYEKK